MSKIIAISFWVVDTIQPPDVIVGCRTDRDCPDFTACENRKCINPCAQRDPCARNAYCKVIMHQPVCTCPDGYIGDPRTNCELRKYQINTFPLVYFLKDVISGYILTLCLYNPKQGYYDERKY